MKPIATIEGDQFGYGHTSVTRPCESGVSLAGIDPDFGFEPFLGVAVRLTSESIVAMG